MKDVNKITKLSTQEKRLHKPNYGKEQLEVLFQDEYIAIVLKPSGMLSVPYPGSRARTAIQSLEEIMHKNGTWSRNHKPYPVHRLDRDTSGVMMFALTEKMQKTIMDSWHKMVTERLYRAVAENPTNSKIPLLADYGLIDEPLAFNAYNVGFVPKEGDFPSNKNANNHNEFATVNARTHFRVVERGAFYTLFELHLDTGKKNQIRAHLASKSYPLAGDENYRAKSDPFHRLALHARTLAFIHPVTKEKMKFEIPEDSYWLTVVQNTKENKFPSIWTKEVVSKKSVEKELSKIRFDSTAHMNKEKRKMNFIERGKKFHK